MALGIYSVKVSIGLLKASFNQPFNLPKEHSVTIQPDDNLLPKNCALNMVPQPKNSLTKKGGNGYTGSSSVHAGTVSEFHYSFITREKIQYLI